MKKLVTFRFDPDLLEKVRRTAEAENRTLTNYVETVLKRAVDISARDAGSTFEQRVGEAERQALEQ